MARKTKVNEPAAEEPESTMPELLVKENKVKCPNHGFDLQIQKGENGVLFAVDNCPVRNNMWKGQTVWERTPKQKVQSKVKES